MELSAYDCEIRLRIGAGETHNEISVSLQRRNPLQRGFSTRSVRRFCCDEGIHYRSGLGERQLDCVVALQVQAVGHSYGRRTMQGLLNSQGTHVSQRRIGNSLRSVAPGPQQGRRQRASRHLNPPLYTALYFGDKIHFDQNEKLAMFGVTHVAAIDGFSRKIVGFITIPVKNPIAIYHSMMKPLLQSYGLWNQVRMDHGTEFTLVVTVQKHLGHLRCNQLRHPALQSTSRQNHRVERLWPEINQRVNYPLKRVLVQMEGNDEIDMSDDIVKYCVSWMVINVIKHAVVNFIAAWNAHRIPGIRGGVPNVLASRSPQTTRICGNTVPSTNAAIAIHRNNGGRALTPEHAFGKDPLKAYQQLQNLRERDFYQRYPRVEEIFQNILHSDGSLFKAAVQYFIALTKSFSELVPNND